MPPRRGPCMVWRTRGVRGSGAVRCCGRTVVPDSPTAASHRSGSSNSSSSPNHARPMPPRRARAPHVIANVAADLWDKRGALAGKIQTLVSRDFRKRSDLKDMNQKKYVELVQSFQKKLEEEKSKWSFRGLELRQFQTSTDNPQRPPEAGAAEGNGTHSHE